MAGLPADCYTLLYFTLYRRESVMQGGLVMAKSGRLELGDNIYGYYRSRPIFNYCDVFGHHSSRIR